jgi:hypothetical protein
LAKENPRWGYLRIRGELLKLGHVVSATSIRNLMQKHRIPTSPRRAGPSWREFLRAQASAIVATDYFTVDTWLYVLFFMELGTRRILWSGVTASPNQEWVSQQARNLIWVLQEQTSQAKFLICDDDKKFREMEMAVVGEDSNPVRWRALAVLCLVQFMLVVDTTVVNVALPHIQRDLGLSGSGFAWVVNGYLLTAVGFLLLGGRLADYFGRRRIFLIGVGVFALASAACGAATAPAMLISSRFVQGQGRRWPCSPPVSWWDSSLADSNNPTP